MLDEEKYKLIVLYSLLNKYELSRFVGILSLIEECVCLTIEDDNYLVCEFEKGHIHGKQIHESIDSAIFDVFTRISESNEIEENLKNEFKTIIGVKKERRRL